MYKDGNKIAIDLLHSQDTQEGNGLEVIVKLRAEDYNLNDFHVYTAIVSQLTYFENVYIICNITNIDYKLNSAINSFNTLKIKKYDNFLVNNLVNTNKATIVLGKVSYPMDINVISRHDTLGKFPIALRFDIGDLEVTPNREEILYSKHSISKIKEKLEAAREELKMIRQNYHNRNISSYKEFNLHINEYTGVPLLDNVYLPASLDDTIMFRGKRYNLEEVNTCLKKLSTWELIKVKFEISDGKKHTTTKNQISLSTIFSKRGVVTYNFISNDCKPVTLRYVKSLPGCISYLHSTYSAKTYYKTYIKRFENIYSHRETPNGLEIAKIILKGAIERILEFKVVTDSSVTENFLADEKNKKAHTRQVSISKGKDENSFIVYKLRDAYKGSGVTPEAIDVDITTLKKTRKLHVYSSRDCQRLKDLFKIFNGKIDIDFIEIPKTRQTMVEDLNNFVKLEDFVNVNYRQIRQIGTARLIEEKVPHIHDLQKLQSLTGLISKNLNTVVDSLSKYSRRFNNSSPLYDEIYELCKNANYFDEEIRCVLNSNIKMLENANFLILMLDRGAYTTSKNKINLAVDYILARKLFRPDLDAVRKLKSETILNIK